MTPIKHEITGTVECLWQQSDFRPGEKHCYASKLKLPAYVSDYPEHFDFNDIRIWLKSMLEFSKIDGQKIKITAELIEE